MSLPQSLAGAEQALIQANRIDKSHAIIWARLAIVSLRGGRVELAHQALLQCLKLRCADFELLRTIGGLYCELGYLDLAASALERSRALRDSAHVRIDLARVRQQQFRLEAAEAHLLQANQMVAEAETEAEADLAESVREQWRSLQKQIGRDEQLPKPKPPRQEEEDHWQMQREEQELQQKMQQQKQQEQEEEEEEQQQDSNDTAAAAF
jgi:hypothetical protein